MNLQDAYYEQKFENEFLRAKGNEFQVLFERLMALAYKADFLPCRPWGRKGDRKNDGFLKSERRLFQVYAPSEMTESRARKKINEDFEGAKEHWGSHFEKWTFVHNATEGLPPHIQELILDFEHANEGLTLDPWCLEELRAIFRTLSDDDKASWFGPVPNDTTKLKLGFEDLKVVLEGISGRPAAPEQEIRDVPAGKVEANALSEAVARLLKEGMAKSSLVAQFLDQWHDETLGERLAESFKAEYERLSGAMGSNEVFAGLLSWAGGDHRGAPEHELAVLTVVAYYFERCDIFKEPRGTAP